MGKRRLKLMCRAGKLTEIRNDGIRVARAATRPWEEVQERA